jgi:hypothetical protein
MSRESYRTSSSYRSSVSGAQARASKARVEASTGRSKLDNYQVPKANTPSVVLNTILNAGQKLRQKSFEVNREYFQKNVAGKRGYKNTFADYQRYITGRGQGTLDAMGRPIQSGDNNQRTVLGSTQQQTAEAPAQTPTPVETEEDIKKKRSTTIMGSGYGQRTMLTSAVGDETEANVSKTVLGGSVRKRI